MKKKKSRTKLIQVSRKSTPRLGTAWDGLEWARVQRMGLSVASLSHSLSLYSSLSRPLSSPSLSPSLAKRALAEPVLSKLDLSTCGGERADDVESRRALRCRSMKGGGLPCRVALKVDRFHCCVCLFVLENRLLAL